MNKGRTIKKQRGRWLKVTSMLLILKHKMDDDFIAGLFVPFRMQRYDLC